MLGIFTTAVAYLPDSTPFGFLIVRWMRGVDVRNTGSGSIGATNVMRNLGIAGGITPFILDAGKGASAVLLAEEMTIASETRSNWIAAAVVAAVGGHCFPMWLKFRGGKGIATGLGAFVLLTPIPIVAWVVIFSVVAGITRYISLGSIIASAAFPALVYFLNRPPFPLAFGAAVGAAIVVAKHYANIPRLLNGTEKWIGR
jgi:glycerol-3-phosphate acyltransferase PlsY